MKKKLYKIPVVREVKEVMKVRAYTLQEANEIVDFYNIEDNFYIDKESDVYGSYTELRDNTNKNKER